MILSYNLFSSQLLYFFGVKITSIAVQVCAIGALLSGKPNKRNESQKFLAVPGAYLSLSQVVQTPAGAQEQRLADCQLCFFPCLQRTYDEDSVSVEPGIQEERPSATVQVWLWIGDTPFLALATYGSLWRAEPARALPLGWLVPVNVHHVSRPGVFHWLQMLLVCSH